MEKGNNIIISYEYAVGAYAPIYATKSSTIEVGCDVIEISSPTTGTWRDYITGRKGWSISVGFLLYGLWQVTDTFTATGTRFHLRIYHRTDTSRYMEGYAILTSAKVTATCGNLVQGSWKFQGCSELVEVRE